jgi:predicted MPP superfamily phosphohydrolase
MLKKATILFLVYLLVISCTGKNHSMTTRPYLSQVTENSIVVSWHTESPMESVIEYGETTACGWIVKDDVKTRMHSIKITGLKPSKKYYYRIPSEGRTENYHFRTAVKSGEDFSFDVYGDGQSNDENHVNVLKQIQKTHPLFIINTGDLTRKDKETNWYDYFSVICDKTNIGETIPIYSTTGNHDRKEKVKESLYFKYFSLPVNNSDYSEAYYSFNIGDAHFVALNSYLSFDPCSPQYKWLAEDLKQSSRYKWKIVFIHEPFYSSGRHGSNIHQRRVLCPLLEKGGVTLVFSGHDHLYERTKSIKGVTYIVTGGGGASLYNATKTEWLARINKSHHFCKVRITKDQCELEMIRSDGTVGDRLILTKSRDPFVPDRSTKQVNGDTEAGFRRASQNSDNAWMRYLYNLHAILSGGRRSS